MSAIDTLRDEMQNGKNWPDAAKEVGNNALEVTLTTARQLMRQAGIVWMVFTSFTKSGDPNKALQEAMEASASLREVKLGDVNDTRYASVLENVFGVKVDDE
jgi:hypothetical protein